MKKVITYSTLILLICCFDNLSFSQTQKKQSKYYVIVLDVQQYWTDKALSKSASKEMVESINTIIERTNPEKVVYIKTTFASKVLNISFKGIKVDTVLAVDFDKNLKLVNQQIFDKKEEDAFSTKEILDFFQGSNVKEILLVGLLAEKCIFKTAMGGKYRGFNITLIPEAIGGKSAKSKIKTMEKLQKSGVKITNLSNWLLTE